MTTTEALTDENRAAEHADGIIDGTEEGCEPERWRAIQEAVRFCAVRSGWRLNFVATSGAPYVQHVGVRSITFRDDTGTWDFFGAGGRRFRVLSDAARAAAEV